MVHHNILWQVQLHSYDSDTNMATFWPAMTAPANYGKQTHTGDCICEHTWAEIVSGSYDFSNCHCTKTVTIDANSNTEIFNISAFGEGTELKSGLLFDSLKPEARVWGTVGTTDLDAPTPTYGTTLDAMQAAWDISGVTVSKFDLLSKSDVESITPESDRIVYNESGNADDWWLATRDESGYSFAYLVGSDGNVYIYKVDNDSLGIAPGFSISKNN